MFKSVPGSDFRLIVGINQHASTLTIYVSNNIYLRTTKQNRTWYVFQLSTRRACSRSDLCPIKNAAIFANSKFLQNMALTSKLSKPLFGL